MSDLKYLNVNQLKERKQDTLKYIDEMKLERRGKYNIAPDKDLMSLNGRIGGYINMIDWIDYYIKLRKKEEEENG